MFFCVLFLSGIFLCNTEGQDVSTNGSMTVILTVAGDIQLFDSWTNGPRTVNQWARPIYRIWVDMNGNPSDGGYGNCMGPKQAELWLDNGQLCFMWFGPDMEHNTEDDVTNCPLKKTGYNTWKDSGIEASITNQGKSLKATIPLVKLNNPVSMEISFMTSPWTLSASDNLGEGSNHRPAWITISDARKSGSYSATDETGDNFWPRLDPDHRRNFDLVISEVIINF